MTVRLAILAAVSAAVLHADGPIPFSHRQHAAAKLACADCHVKADSAERAGFPAASKCMACHVSIQAASPHIQRLAALPKDAAPFPTQRIYKLPDFVFFSHARHRAAKVPCDTCHGPVAERDVLTKEVPTTMKACVACHRSHNATVACTACHEVNQ